MKYDYVKFNFCILLILLAISKTNGQQNISRELSFPSFVHETIRIHKNNVHTEKDLLFIQNSQLIALQDLKSNSLLKCMNVDSAISRSYLLQNTTFFKKSLNKDSITFLDKFDGRKFLSSYKYGENLFTVFVVNYYYYENSNNTKINSFPAYFLIQLDKNLNKKNTLILPLYSEKIDVAYSAPFIFDHRDSSFVFSNSLTIYNFSSLENTRVTFLKIKPINKFEADVTKSIICDSSFTDLINFYLSSYKNSIGSPEICSNAIRYIIPVWFHYKEKSVHLTCGNEIVNLQTCSKNVRLNNNLDKIKYTQSIELNNKIYCLGWIHASNKVQYYLSIFDMNGNNILNTPINNIISKLYEYNNSIYYIQSNENITDIQSPIFITEIPNK